MLALVDPHDREWTRGELLADANQIAHGLRARGLGKGDCVAIVSGELRRDSSRSTSPSCRSACT